MFIVEPNETQSPCPRTYTSPGPPGTNCQDSQKSKYPPDLEERIKQVEAYRRVTPSHMPALQPVSSFSCPIIDLEPIQEHKIQ